ncbi:hypothetical protein RND71_003056 [Anisodus tanguticus]|uniref:Uncharacterized protein n=1 Tax=Anisodus tanguticus TaxID=243964 RepID=A0AAE1SVY7_9SOLA|nr:hypothetical protein RND71_003056 [Anisodus tanguticus]
MAGELSPSITLLNFLEVIDIGELVGDHGENFSFDWFTSSESQETQLSWQQIYLCITTKHVIPVWIGSLSRLYPLNLSKNKFVSEIPSTITNLENLGVLDLHTRNLGVLDLHTNKLEGNVNAVFQMKSRFEGGSLTYLDLSGNCFSRVIDPIGMGGQENIRYLNISHNFLEGSNLPTSLANASTLERLMLQKNQSTGRIPEEFLKLINLKELNLSDNRLEGKIPYGKPFLDFPSSSFSGNRGLCGKPLPPCKS